MSEVPLITRIAKVSAVVGLGSLAVVPLAGCEKDSIETNLNVLCGSIGEIPTSVAYETVKTDEGNTNVVFSCEMFEGDTGLPPETMKIFTDASSERFGDYRITYTPGPDGKPLDIDVDKGLVKLYDATNVSVDPEDRMHL